MVTYQKLLIIFFLFLGLLTRLYKINSPIADWHSHRQADTASVTKSFLNNGIDLLHPTYHDLSNVQSGKDNPKGLRLVEFPIYNLFSFGIHNLVKIFYPPIAIEISFRLTSITLSLLSAFLVYLISYQITRRFLPSFFSFSTFLLLPFSVYYSRAILPEPLAVSFMLLSLFFLLKSQPFLSFTFLSLSLLVKPYTAIILLPVFLFLSLNQNKIDFKYLIHNVLYLILSLLPLILWRKWILQFPEGIPANTWLLNSSTSTALPNWFHGYDLTFFNKLVAFKPYWFKWLFYERLGNLILGSFGLIPLFLGFAYKKNRSQSLLCSFALGTLLYFILIAGGNIQHDYYQTLIIPFISIIVGFGLYYTLNFLFKSKFISIFSVIIISVFALLFSWFQIKEYYKINNPNIVEAGKIVDQTLSKNALIIAPYNGDTAFLYQTNRSGWPIEIYDLIGIKRQHPQNSLYLVSVNFDKYTNDMIQKYKTILKNDKFIILDLN